MNEEWRAVPYAPDYEVSTLGRVRSLKRWRGVPGPRFLNGRIAEDYHFFKLMTLTLGEIEVSGHRLVAHTFLGHQLEGVEVRHLDGDGLNNRLDNLEYGTHGMNMLDAVRHGTHNMARKTHCKHGHEFTPENTYWRSTGGRACRECRRLRSVQYEVERKAARVAARASMDTGQRGAA